MDGDRLLRTAVLLAVLAGAGCSGERPAVDPPVASTRPASPAPLASSAQPAVAALPDGALRALVPVPGEVPAGMVPLLQGSGPRVVEDVAGFSTDAAAAAAALREAGFADAYVAQYASPTDARSLTVVVVRYGSADGAERDLARDTAGESGQPVADAAEIGEASSARRLALGDGAELVTVRFRAGATTWLVAWRAPEPADARVPLELAGRLADRA